VTSWGRVAGAALGLLLVASPIAPLRAQTDPFTAPAECSDPPPAPQRNGIKETVTSPTGTGVRTSADVPVEASFSDESTRPIVGGFNGHITQMRASVLVCEAGQIAPTSPEPQEPDGEPRTAAFAWSAHFPTNGRFAIVLEADGVSTGPEGTQHNRTVVPVQLAVPPKKPSNVSVSDPVNGIVSITWEYVEPEPDLVGFEIRRAKQGTADYVTIKNGVVGPKIRAVSDSPPAGAWFR
jgi:hypothetical protein